METSGSWDWEAAPKHQGREKMGSYEGKTLMPQSWTTQGSERTARFVGAWVDRVAGVHPAERGVELREEKLLDYITVRGALEQ